MQNLSNLSPKARFSLLWSQYNVLPKSLKEGFFALAQHMLEEINDQELIKDAYEFPVNGVPVDKGRLPDGN